MQPTTIATQVIASESSAGEIPHVLDLLLEEFKIALREALEKRRSSLTLEEALAAVDVQRFVTFGKKYLADNPVGEIFWPGNGPAFRLSNSRNCSLTAANVDDGRGKLAPTPAVSIFGNY